MLCRAKQCLRYEFRTTSPTSRMMSHTATRHTFEQSAPPSRDLLKATKDWNLRWRALTEYLRELEESAHRQAADARSKGQSPEVSQSMGLLCRHIRLDMESFEPGSAGKMITYSSHALRMLSASWHVESVVGCFEHEANAVEHMSSSATYHSSQRSKPPGRLHQSGRYKYVASSQGERTAFDIGHRRGRAMRGSNGSSQTNFTDLDYMEDIIPSTPLPLSP